MGGDQIYRMTAILVIEGVKLRVEKVKTEWEESIPLSSVMAISKNVVTELELSGTDRIQLQSYVDRWFLQSFYISFHSHYMTL